MRNHEIEIKMETFIHFFFRLYSLVYISIRMVASGNCAVSTTATVIESNADNKFCVCASRIRCAALTWSNGHYSQLDIVVRAHLVRLYHFMKRGTLSLWFGCSIMCTSTENINGFDNRNCTSASLFVCISFQLLFSLFHFFFVFMLSQTHPHTHTYAKQKNCRWNGTNERRTKTRTQFKNEWLDVLCKKWIVQYDFV